MVWLLAMLYIKSSFFDDYYFKMAGEYSVLKQSYPVYSVVSKYKNENITMQEEGEVVVIAHQKEQQQKQNESRNIFLVDDTFTDSQEALKTFCSIRPLPLQINPFGY
jgi:hypothetical protein